jgi:hypothetical protein
MNLGNQISLLLRNAIIGHRRHFGYIRFSFRWVLRALRRCAILVFSAGIIWCFLNDTKAAPLLDQYYNPLPRTTFAEVDEDVDHAQTFTVGIGGQLTSVDVFISKGPNATQDLLFDVRRTNGGVPIEDNDLGTDSVLANARVPVSVVSINQFRFINIDISTFNVLVSPGEVLALVLRPSEPFVPGDDDGYGWGGNLDDNQYIGGAKYSRSVARGIPWQLFPTRDLGFATYVRPTSVPENPPTFLLGGLGICALVAYSGFLRRNNLHKSSCASSRLARPTVTPRITAL